MACNTNITEILKGCDNNAGGLKRIFLAGTEDVLSSTVVAGEVTAITMDGSELFVEYQFNKNSASYVEEAGIDLTAGSTFFTTTLTLNIARRDVAKRNSISLVAGGQRDLKIIMEDSNGIYWYMGLSESANLTAVGEGSGTVKADGSKYSLTFVAEEVEMMPVVDPTIIAALIA